MHNFKRVILSSVIIALIVSCSTTKEAATPPEETKEQPLSIYPAWYHESGFSADSVSYSAYSTSIAADSIKAISTAEKYARIALENELSLKLESARVEMAANGSDLVQQKEFLFMLKNAQNQLSSECELKEFSAAFQQNHYRGFAKVSVSYTQLLNILEKGFSDNSGYWSAFSSSEAFKEELN